MSARREIPVTFTDACAQSILAGRKTQARRVVRDPTEACPFGEPGDRLWLRETTEMTRERARVVVEVEGVRREPLQAISDQDLAAEGDVTREPFADAEERRQLLAGWNQPAALSLGASGSGGLVERLVRSLQGIAGESGEGEEEVGDLRLHLLDRHLQAMPVGAIGELCVGGERLGWGYLGRAELTAERFVPDPFVGLASVQPGGRLFRTGERVLFGADGRFFVRSCAGGAFGARASRFAPSLLQVVRAAERLPAGAQRGPNINSRPCTV